MRDKDTLLMEKAYSNILLNELNLKQAAAIGGMALGSLLPNNKAEASQPIQTANMSEYEAEQSVKDIPRLFENEEKLKSLVPILQKFKNYFGQNSGNLPFKERDELKTAVSKAYGISDPDVLFIVVKRDIAEFNHKNDVSPIEDFVMTGLSYFYNYFRPSDDHKKLPLVR